MIEERLERIWLIHDAEADERITWSDNPNPYAEYGETPDAAIEYVRADSVRERVERLEGALRGICDLDPLLPKKGTQSDPCYGFRAARQIAHAALSNQKEPDDAG